MDRGAWRVTVHGAAKRHYGGTNTHFFHFHKMEVRKNMAGMQEITNLFSSIACHVIKLVGNYEAN